MQDNNQGLALNMAAHIALCRDLEQQVRDRDARIAALEAQIDTLAGIAADCICMAEEAVDNDIEPHCPFCLAVRPDECKETCPGRRFVEWRQANP